MQRKFLLILAVFLCIQSVSALSSIGTAPGYTELGTIERGETREVEFYITSDASEPFELQASYSDPLYSRIFTEGSEIQQEFSRQDLGPWVNIPGNPFLIDPNDTTTRTLESGAGVSSQGTVTIEIRVPQDAEPGYRAGSLNFNPVNQDSGNTFGSANYGIAKPSFTFRVPGEVERNIDLIDVRGRRIGDESAQIIAEFQNTGTVTTVMSGDTIPILNEANQEVGEVNFNQRELAPGEIVREDVTWRGDSVQGGEYHLEGSMNFMTGNFYVGDQEASFVIAEEITGDRIEVEESTNPNEPDDEGISTFLVLIFLVLVGVILYSFDIDPFMIVIALCGLGIITLVLISGIPLWTIPILLIGVGGIMYYV